MKFTNNIQEEIDNKVLAFTILYHEEGDAAVRKNLNCDVLIRSNHSGCRYYALRRDDHFYFRAGEIDAEIDRHVQKMECAPEEREALRFKLQDAARQEVKNRVIDFYISNRAARGGRQ